MSSNPKIFSLQGKGLKLNTRADIAPLLQDIDPAIIEEIHFGGNTIGVEASLALAEFLEKAKALKVSKVALLQASPPKVTMCARLPTLQISSLVV